ncbi:hypothetical protein BGZ54_008362, partial [Gamsiella multidivaricata]
MKVPSLLSIAALVAVVTAQSSDNAAESAAVTKGDDIASMPPTESLDNGLEPQRGGPTLFTAWSSPGFKGHKQRNKNTPGCYRLDGGAVGSFDASRSYKYAFFNDNRCKNRMIYGWTSAPIRRFNPLIYPG